ncbi:DUF6377 domain-containing protein [Mucilaginibacter sp. KACC 22063]|uniref:DUF6377 domain-containing protein n=1 Tax=Mucilaginibacter sp. KACC 22063 TaxID=3025666 RepID=UPI0023669BBE|nr:DUF6377 domain-containing protein [Mucilaginibacter sp. KACC 22063]WDF56715.1 DUF6377 domain-containing protein [Mucilaginibacter sp. KACC 22063]
MRLLLPTLILLLLATQAKSNANDSLYLVLKNEILNKKIFDARKEGRINQLKHTLARTDSSDYNHQYNLCSDIYDEYRDYIFDSAHVYSQKLHYLSTLMHDHNKQHESRIKLATVQLSWGMLKEAFDYINSINPKELSNDLMLSYYGLKAAAYLHLYFYNTDQFYVDSNRKRATAALDSALMYAKPGSYYYYRYKADLFALNGQKNNAAEYYRKLLADSSITFHQRAMAANNLGNLCNGDERIGLITTAAIYDVRSSTKETLAIFTLARHFFDNGNLEKAEFLLKEAHDEASFYGNRIHEEEIVALLTTLNAQKLINAQAAKNKILTLLLGLVVAAIGGTLGIAKVLSNRLKKVKMREEMVQKKNQHLDEINKTLSEDGRIKEEYIGNFFNMISCYIQKLEKIKRTADHSFKTKNFAELLTITREINPKKERENLFNTFDRIFLKLFPNFINSFNSLLKEEEQIWPKGEDVLNTNLRIFALMRLGIKDNQTIASILENSLSTIYTYKTRVKSKAVVKPDDFDKKIMEIKLGAMT